MDGTWVPGGHRRLEEETSPFRHGGEHIEKTHHLSRMAQLGECQETGLAQEIGIREETAVEQRGLVGERMGASLQNPRKDLQTLGCGRAEVLRMQLISQAHEPGCTLRGLHSKETCSWGHSAFARITQMAGPVIS